MRVAMAKHFNRQLIGIKSEKVRKAANSCVEKFFDNPSTPGLNLESLPGTGGFWSIRVNRDMRVIVHKGREEWMLLHVDHHDAAYRWAERASVQRHSHTGGIQIRYTEEVYREEVSQYSPPEPERPPIFDGQNEDYLLDLGVPEEALPALRDVASDEEFDAIGERLPEDVWDRLLSLYLGEPVEVPEPISDDDSSLNTPEALREFFVTEDKDELKRALEAPWAEWLVFLHPLQRQAAYSDFRGPAKVTGTAGTGKTVVALHRARRLARQSKRVLLTTFSNTLAADLKEKLDLLCKPSESEMIEVVTVHGMAREVLCRAGVRPKTANEKRVSTLLEEARRDSASQFSDDFLKTEWERVIVAQGIDDWEQYRDAPRAGRGVPLRASERKRLWEVFGEVRRRLAKTGETTYPDLCRAAKKKVEGGAVESPYEAVIVDEVQDLNPQEILFLKALGGLGTNGLTLIGDGGQRIYPGGFSLRALGIEVRGRSRGLRVNYRTSQQIRRFADQLLGFEADDLDEGTESRAGVRNLFSGPEPEVHSFGDGNEEDEWLAWRISGLMEDGLDGCNIAVFARTRGRLYAIQAALRRHGIGSVQLKDNIGHLEEAASVRLGTMHRAKGLEYRAVFLASINRGLLPHQRSIGDRDDALEWRQAYQRERHLLYVNITRARELVYLCYHGVPSPFLLEAGFVDDEEESA